MKKRAILVILLFFTVFSVSYAQVNMEKYRVDTDSLGFSVRAGLDFTFMVGNSDFQYLGTNTRFNYNWGDHYTFLITNGGYGQSNGKNFFGQALVHWRNVNSISNGIQLEEFVQYDNNKKRLLLHRGLVGGGFRFKIINTPKLESRIGTSVFYEQEKYDLLKTASHETFVETVRFSSSLSFLIVLKDDVSLSGTTYVQPAVKSTDDLKVLSDNAIKIILGKNVGLTTKVNIRYDSRPADGIKKFDLTSKFGVTFNFE